MKYIPNPKLYGLELATDLKLAISKHNHSNVPEEPIDEIEMVYEQMSTLSTMIPYRNDGKVATYSGIRISAK